MAGHGPPPKHRSVRARRNAPMANTTKLPVKGRKGDPPAWPLAPVRELRADLAEAEDEASALEGDLAYAVNPDEKRALASRLRRALARVERVNDAMRYDEARELALWRVLWAKPQAVAWERHGYLNVVARYVRLEVRAEELELKAAREARMLEKELGLTDMAMLHLRWEIASDELAERRDAPAEDKPRRRRPAKKPAAKEDPRGALRLA